MNLRKAIYLDRKILGGLLFLTLIVSGIRFSDGSLLLSIASGSGLENPLFNNQLTQYIWDSPLKIFLLKLLPKNILWIAFAFLIISMLPLIGIFARTQSTWYYLTASLIALTPSIKVSLQNIGVGDGLVYLLILVAVCSSTGPIILLTILLIALWHPQQAFFITGTYLLFSLNYESKILFKKRLLWGASGLLVGGIIFFVYKASLHFTYYDRTAYLLYRLQDLPMKNLMYFPISLFYTGFWLYIIRRIVPSKPITIYLYVWVFILISVSVLTTDVTRVLSIVALPAFLIPLLIAHNGEKSPNFPIAWILISIAFPVYSWSGIDIFLWSDIFRDLCKYSVFCL